MKKTILFSILLLIGFTVSAQDIITLKNGDEIQALVQEIGDVDVKYKKFDNPNGPNYTLKKAEIFMIRYANGSRDVFATEPVIEVVPPLLPATRQPNTQRQVEMQLEPLSIDGVQIYNSNGKKLSRSEIQNIMRNVPEALDLYNSGIRRRGTGTGFAIPGNILFWGGFATWITGIITEDPDIRTAGLVLEIASIPFNIVSIITTSSGNRRIRNAVGTYNREIRQGYTSDMSLNMGITKSGGLGLTLTF